MFGWLKTKFSCAFAVCLRSQGLEKTKKSKLFCSTGGSYLGFWEVMGRISGLSEDLLVKILSFLPTKNAVSTSVLSKQWEFLWTWLPKLEYDMSDSESKPVFRDFVNKTLPLHRAPVIDSFSLEFDSGFIQRDDLKLWAGIVVSRCVRELSICCSSYWSSDAHVLPSSLYTCKSLVTLILEDVKVFVDVPRMVSLPSLKTLKLRRVTYLNEDSLGLFLSYCPVLEDLVIDRRKDDNMRALVVDVPSLQRLSLDIDEGCSSDDEYVVGTPLLKYFKVNDVRCSFHYLIEHMPKLEEADINVLDDIGKLLKSVTTVKRLSLYTVLFQGEVILTSSCLSLATLIRSSLIFYRPLLFYFFVMRAVCVS